jgi:hypothetical protein
MPVLLIILVLASGLVVGCGQSQKQRDILDYLDKTIPLQTEYLEAIVAVMEAYKQDERESIWKSRDVNRLLEVLANEKKAANQTLEKVNYALSFLETTPPPREAKTLHTLWTRALQTARDGLLKLLHSSGIRYEYLYSVLNPSVPKKELPPGASEELTQGLHLMGEAVRMLGEAQVEVDNLMKLIGVK